MAYNDGSDGRRGLGMNNAVALGPGDGTSARRRAVKQRPVVLRMPDCGEQGVITAQFAGDRAWCEFRGRPYSQWMPGEATPMALLHDALEGWHTSVLHTDEPLTLMPSHHGALYDAFAAALTSDPCSVLVRYANLPTETASTALAGAVKGIELSETPVVLPGLETLAVNCAFLPLSAPRGSGAQSILVEGLIAPQRVCRLPLDAARFRGWYGPRTVEVCAPDVAALAKIFSNQYIEGEPGFARADDLAWIEVSDYPIARLADAPDAAWFAEERAMWAEEGQPDRYDDMLDREILCPIVVYDNGLSGYIWDGNHRIGALVTRERTTVSAWVGVPRESLSWFQPCRG